MHGHGKPGMKWEFQYTPRMLVCLQTNKMTTQKQTSSSYGTAIISSRKLQVHKHKHGLVPKPSSLTLLAVLIESWVDGWYRLAEYSRDIHMQRQVPIVQHGIKLKVFRSVILWSREKSVCRKGNENTEKIENGCLQGAVNFGFGRYKVNW